MTPDFSYMNCSDGFVAIAPNTPQAEAEYNRMFAETGGMRLMPHEFKGFKVAARKAGYSVRKAVSAKFEPITDEMLAELMA
jgi:hypothetical protein